MKIKIKLTLQFSLIVTTILLLFSTGIYYFSAEYRSNEFKKKLTNRAITVAKLMTVVADTNNALFDKINKNTVNLLYNENILVYDFNSLRLLYCSINDSSENIKDTTFLKMIKENGSAEISKKEREITGIIYPEIKPKYISVASAVDNYGINVLKNLKFILFGGLIIGLVMVIIAAFFFATEALRPISKIIRQVDKITASNMHSRVIVEESKDEISTLAFKFNNMLDRLEDAFIMQKNFVSNASHELRTPLTSMKGQIDVTLMKNRDVDEYISVLNSLMADTENMTTLINGFLEMAETSMENKLLKIQPLKIDELLFLVKKEILKRKNNYSIHISFDESIKEESNLFITANSHLLKILFSNLIDNACKFSDNHTANILIKCKNKWIDIRISDEGIGIPEDEINKITEPFYRASNATHKGGHGIGLSISSRIVSLHKGELKISSEVNKGTTINIILPIELEV